MKNIKRLSFVLALLMITCCVLSSCGSNYKALKIDPDYVSKRAESTTQTINGIDGVKVSVPKSVESVVCFSREAATVIRELGLANKIKAGDKMTGQVIVGINETTIDKISSLSPDVVFITEDYDTSALDSANITYLTIPEQMTVNDVKSMIKMIEKIFGITAESLSVKIDNEMTLAQQTTSSFTKKYSAFIDMGGFKTSGKGTYVNEILSAAGCENIFADEEGFITSSKEDIIKANPSVIFTTDKKIYTRDESFADVDAVANNRVYVLQERQIAYGSQYIAEALSTMFDSINSLSTEK